MWLIWGVERSCCDRNVLSRKKQPKMRLKRRAGPAYKAEKMREFPLSSMLWKPFLPQSINAEVSAPIISFAFCLSFLLNIFTQNSAIKRVPSRDLWSNLSLRMSLLKSFHFSNKWKEMYVRKSGEKFCYFLM